MPFDYLQGTIIEDRYPITGVLGKGGVAVTYSAVDLETESLVAVKVISLKQLKNWKQGETGGIISTRKLVKADKSILITYYLREVVLVSYPNLVAYKCHKKDNISYKYF